jgi:two-component system response regulator
MMRANHMILLAEDNPDDVELTQLALRDGNCAHPIEVVRDGAEALDYLFRQGAYADRHPDDEPRAVLLDIKMPLVDGIEVLRRIKQDVRTRHLPVIMLTSSAQERDLAACYRWGSNSYIVKPVDADTFLEAVRQIGLYWLVLNQKDKD